MLADGSLARTAKVWLPSGSEAVVFGELQGLKLPPSILHSKLEPASLAENSKVGVGSLVGPVGPESIVVSGAVLSIAIST